MKVVIAGLDYAGKTSLINRLINDYNYNDMINLEPTIGANVEEYQSEKLDLVLWDLGGQRDHIDEYLSSPEQFFVHVDVLIFVFDSQDDIRYDEATKFLNDITNIFSFLNENPYIVILLNKADSDIVNDPDYQIKVEYLTDKVSKIFMTSEKAWNFEMIPTSIYNFYSNEPEIARSIKNIFSKEKPSQVAGKILPDIDDKLQKILDINLKLMDKMVGELSEVKRVLSRIVPSDLSQSIFSVPFEKVPLDYISRTTELTEKERKKKKKSKNNDYVENSKQYKKSSGPPKRLKEFPVPNSAQKDILKDGKITTEKIKNVKQSLSVSTPKSLSSSPPMAPKSETISLGILKPPPPPKLVSKVEEGRDNIRTQVITELKDIFIKRGLVSR